MCFSGVDLEHQRKKQRGVWSGNLASIYMDGGRSSGALSAVRYLKLDEYDWTARGLRAEKGDQRDFRRVEVTFLRFWLDFRLFRCRN